MGSVSLLLLLCLAAGAVVLCAGVNNLAIIRPFATTDSANLAASFDIWTIYPPCAASPAVPVDLFLCFSQNLSSDAEAASTTHAIVQEFNAQQANGSGWTWPSCFRSVRAVSAYITPQDDTYLPGEYGQNPDWVKGPNLQFLAMAQAFGDGTWGDYDAWFLMEMDTTPRRANWLPDLLQEVTARAPFAVLGSFYRGDQWDRFPMPPAVRQHINGNAVYNKSNPLMQQIVSTLRAAMAVQTTRDAFDVFGAEVYLNSTLQPDQLGWYAGDSAVIGNYAHTPMLDDYFADEALVHGGWLYADWNATAQPITLLVSDFGRWDAQEPAWTELETFEAALLQGRHPFRRVVVVRPPANVSAAPYARQTTGDMGAVDVAFQEVARNDSVWFDWCSAPIDTPWFLYTNVFFDFRHRVDLRLTLNGSLPVASYTPAGSSYCLDSDVCVYTMGRAKNFSGYAPTGHVDLSQLVLRTAQRDQFCAAWREWHASQPAAACEPIPGPTADDYAAYLLSQGLNSLYSWENVLQRGQRLLGVQRSFPVDPRPCAFPAVATNATLCDFITEESTCSSVPGCAWRPHFDICFQGSLVTIPPPPALNVTYGAPAGCPADFATPLLRISSLDSRNVTLVVPGVPGWQRTLGTGAATDLPVWNGSATGAVAVQPLLVVSTAPQVLFSIPVPLYQLQSLNAIASPRQTYIGNCISISASTTAVRRLAVRPAAGLAPVSPVAAANGWMLSTDDAAPNLIIFDTSGLPPNTSQLSLAVRLTGTVSAVPVQRCTTVTIDLVPTAIVPCTSALSLSSYVGQADSTIIAKVTTDDSPLVNVSGFTWTIGLGLPVTTAGPTAALLLPLVPATTNLTATVVAGDAFGRSMTCQATVTALGVAPAVVLDIIQTQCSTDTASNSSLRCLQAATAMTTVANATGTTPQAAAVLVAQTLTNVALGLPLNSSLDSNAVLMQLSVLTTSTMAASNLQLQSALTSVLVRVVDAGLLDGTSAGPLLAVASPLLAVLTDALAMPAHGTNSTDPTEELAQSLAAVLDRAAVTVAASQGQLYSSSAAQSPTQCLNLSWAYQTAGSLPLGFAGLQLTDALAGVLPPTVRLIVLSTTQRCNVFRNTLGADAEVHRLLLLNGTSGELLTPAAFLRLTGGAVDLWRAPLVFETAPTATAGRAKFGVQVVQPSQPVACVTVDPTTGERRLFAPANGTCGMRVPGSVSAIWVPLTPNVGLDNATVSRTTSTASGSTQVAIAAGVGAAVAGCVVASAVAVWSGRRSCLSRGEPGKVYAPDDVPAERPSTADKSPPESPASQLAKPLPPAKDGKAASGVGAGGIAEPAKNPLRGIPRRSAQEEWRRRSTLYSADSAGGPPPALPHRGLQLHPAPFPSAINWESFSLAMQDSFEYDEENPPHPMGGKGLPPSRAAVPLFPWRHDDLAASVAPAAPSPPPRVAEPRSGHRGICVDGAGTLASHGPLQSPIPYPDADGLDPHWNEDHSYPGWYLLPRRRLLPDSACLNLDPPSPNAAAQRAGTSPSPGGRFVLSLDPVLPFEDEVQAGEEGAGPGWQPMTPRVAWGVMDFGVAEEMVATGNLTAHSTDLEVVPSDVRGRGSAGSQSEPPPEPLGVWLTPAPSHVDSHLDLTFTSEQSDKEEPEAAEQPPAPRHPGPQPYAAYGARRRRCSEFGPRAPPPERRCASLVAVAEDDPSTSPAFPPRRAWAPAQMAEAAELDADSSELRVPPPRRGGRQWSTTAPPSTEEEMGRGTC